MNPVQTISVKHTVIIETERMQQAPQSVKKSLEYVCFEHFSVNTAAVSCF